MTITELIGKLQKQLKLHGDIEVVIQESVEDVFYYEDPLSKERRFLILNNKV